MSQQAAAPARFVEGSTMRHVVVMTSTGSVGLMAIFLVDFANLFYLSLLGEQELAAAIGYAGTLMFFNVSVSIGISIAVTALVSRALGAGDRDKARRLAASGLIFCFVVMVLLAAILAPLLGPILTLLGAAGRTHELAHGFLLIVIPSMPLLGIGMAAAGLLRAVGDAKRAMYVTLSGGIVTALLDPIFIFWLGLGIDGAAMVSVITRGVLATVGLYGAIRIHDLVARPSVQSAIADTRPIFAIAGPAILTNIATPIGNAYITFAIAPHGDAAVAGWAIIGRIIPVAFGPLFALSGAVGPIIGQNFGARRFDRLRGILRDSFSLIIGYTIAVWILLALLHPVIISIFNASGDSAALITFFCLIVAGSFLFNGMLFSANAAFNNLGFPALSTVFNWGRATLGTIPFAAVGGALYGAEGVLAGQGVGAVIFGLAAAVAAFRVVGRLESTGPSEPGPPSSPWFVALSPFSTGKSATGAS